MVDVNEPEDAITFDCERCLHDLTVSTAGLRDWTRFICSECGADYGTWHDIKARLVRLLAEAQSRNEQELNEPTEGQGDTTRLN